MAKEVLSIRNFNSISVLVNEKRTTDVGPGFEVSGTSQQIADKTLVVVTKLQNEIRLRDQRRSSESEVSNFVEMFQGNMTAFLTEIKREFVSVGVQTKDVKNLKVFSVDFIRDSLSRRRKMSL